MNKDFSKKIFNIENSTTRNIIFLIVGIIIISIATIIFSFNYTRISVEQILKFESQIILMFISALTCFIGIAVFIASLNLNNPTIRFILVLILGALIYAVVREEPIRVAFVMFLSSFAVFVVTKIFGKVFSTIITFSLSSFLVIIFMKLLLMLIPNLQVVCNLYISIAMMLLLYNILGVKLNQLCH